MAIFSPIMVDLKGKLIDDRELVVPAIAFEQAFLFDELERLKRRLTPGEREWLRDVGLQRGDKQHRALGSEPGADARMMVVGRLWTPE